MKKDKKVSEALQPKVTGNDYWDYLTHEVQVVCNCSVEDAGQIITLCNSLSANPMEFIQKLPDFVGETHPDAKAVIKALERIRDEVGAQKATVLFPKGYANRKERREKEKYRNRPQGKRRKRR